MKPTTTTTTTTNNNNTALTNDEALELLAYLLSSAHGCINEPADYGILRLVSAADRIARMWAPRATGDLADCLRNLGTQMSSEAAGMDADLEGFAAYLDKQIKELATIVKQHGLTGSTQNGP